MVVREKAWEVLENEARSTLEPAPFLETGYSGGSIHIIFHRRHFSFSECARAQGWQLCRIAKQGSARVLATGCQSSYAVRSQPERLGRARLGTVAPGIGTACALALNETACAFSSLAGEHGAYFAVPTLADLFHRRARRSQLAKHTAGVSKDTI